MNYLVEIRVNELSAQLRFPCQICVILKCTKQENSQPEVLASTRKQQKGQDDVCQISQSLSLIVHRQKLKKLRLCAICYSQDKPQKQLGFCDIQPQELQSKSQNRIEKQLKFSIVKSSLKYTICQYQQIVQLQKKTSQKVKSQKQITLGPVSIPGISSYENLPYWTQKELQEKRTSGNKVLLLYEDLIVDATKFQHPGSNKLLKEINQNQIKQLFDKTQHSLIAKIFLCEMTIGRLKDSQVSNTNGRKVIEQVKNNKDYQFHLQTVKKIDFTKSIDNQLALLTPEEKTALADFPKIINNPINLRVFENEELYYPNSRVSEARFWISTPIFLLNSLIFLGYAVFNLENDGFFANTLIFILGITVWTLIQYYFHRFLLHKGFNSNFKKKQHLHPHEIHHAFPNKRAILSLSPMKNYPTILGIFMFLYFCFGLNFSLYFMSGLLLGMATYDSIHYFVHFGPDTNIQPFASLRTHHLKHHYRNRDKGFGVSTTLWDHLFGTGYK